MKRTLSLFFRRPAVRELLIFLSFLGLTCVMTWPWITHLRDAASDPGDPYLNSWILWWDYHQTFHSPLNLFHANIFYPYRYTLAFSENNYGIAVLFFPLFALGMRPLTIHGLATLLGFAFCGYGAFRLTRTLTGSIGAAWIAGIVFAFIPFRFGQLPHLNYLFAGWIPILLEALVLFVRDRSRRYAAWLAVAFLMNGLTCVHWFVLTLIPLALSFLILVVRSGVWRDGALWRRGIVAVGLASLGLIPFLLPYARAAELYGFVRNPQETLFYSARPIDWLVGEYRSKVWGRLNMSVRGAEKALFPGLLPPLLALAAFFLVEPSGQPDGIANRKLLKKFVVCLDVVVIVCGIMILLISGSGFLKVRLFGYYLIELYSASPVFVVLVTALLIRILIAYPEVFKRAREQNILASLRSSRRSEAFWLGAIWTLVGFLGSLGMNFYFHQFLYEYVPLFRSIRVPARWAMICYLGLALLAGLGAKELTCRLSRYAPKVRPIAIYVAIAVAVLAEQWVVPLNLIHGAVDPDALTLRLKQTPMAGGIVELPTTIGKDENYLYTLRAADHGGPLITAVSGFAPPLQRELQSLTHEEVIPESFIDRLESIPCSYLVVHNDFLEPANRLAIETVLAQAIASHRVRFVRSYGSQDLYAVTKTEPNVKSEGQPPFPIPEKAAVVSDVATNNSAANGTAANPIDDARFFVRTQYLDFLEREPDAAGLDYWIALLQSCGKDDRCLEEQRVKVAGAFLAEKEFRDTGSFLYCLYEGTLGRPPSYAEFKIDRAKVIGGPGLDASKSVFLEEWVSRPQFTRRYSANLKPPQFIDQLLRTVNAASRLDLRQQRQGLIDELARGVGRTGVVRKITEDAAFSRVEHDRASVAMQYFGYLKRDPDRAGYTFWVNIISKHKPDDYQSMVRAFITSKEYRARFIPPGK
jgi:hypothetical protein